jgi:hypothetical protein
LLAAWILVDCLATLAVPSLRLRYGQQQAVVDVGGVSAIDLTIAKFLEELAAVPPQWKIQNPNRLAILIGT